jgi:DNA-directed RNA polymerase specialized sigma24 family protein
MSLSTGSTRADCLALPDYSLPGHEVDDEERPDAPLISFRSVSNADPVQFRYSRSRALETLITTEHSRDRSPRVKNAMDQPLLDLYQDQHVRNALERVVRSLNQQDNLHQDLMQEALIHLWQMEQARPGQCTSWYLQSCRFHLQHWLGAGRRVDSTKRRTGQVLGLENDQGPGGFLEQVEADNREFEHASARDLIDSMTAALRPRERAVLACLAEELGSAEIVRRLKLSYGTVAKCRRRIAHAARKLGLGQ